MLHLFGESLKGVISNVSPSTADLLAYSFLVMVGVFLISGPIIVYLYYKRNQREHAASAPAA